MKNIFNRMASVGVMGLVATLFSCATNEVDCVSPVQGRCGQDGKELLSGFDEMDKFAKEQSVLVHQYLAFVSCAQERLLESDFIESQHKLDEARNVFGSHPLERMELSLVRPAVVLLLEALSRQRHEGMSDAEFRNYVGLDGSVSFTYKRWPAISRRATYGLMWVSQAIDCLRKGEYVLAAELLDKVQCLYVQPGMYSPIMTRELHCVMHHLSSNAPFKDGTKPWGEAFPADARWVVPEGVTPEFSPQGTR